MENEAFTKAATPVDLKVILGNHAHSFEYGLGWVLLNALAQVT